MPACIVVGGIGTAAGAGAVAAGVVLGTDPPAPKGVKVEVELVEDRKPENHGVGCGPKVVGAAGTLALGPPLVEAFAGLLLFAPGFTFDVLVELANGSNGTTPGGTELGLL